MVTGKQSSKWSLMGLALAIIVAIGMMTAVTGHVETVVLLSRKAD